MQGRNRSVAGISAGRFYDWLPGRCDAVRRPLMDDRRSRSVSSGNDHHPSIVERHTFARSASEAVCFLFAAERKTSSSVLSDGQLVLEAGCDNAQVAHEKRTKTRCA